MRTKPCSAVHWTKIFFPKGFFFPTGFQGKTLCGTGEFVVLLMFKGKRTQETEEEYPLLLSYTTTQLTISVVFSELDLIYSGYSFRGWERRKKPPVFLSSSSPIAETLTWIICSSFASPNHPHNLDACKRCYQHHATSHLPEQNMRLHEKSFRLFYINEDQN